MFMSVAEALDESGTVIGNAQGVAVTVVVVTSQNGCRDRKVWNWENLPSV